MSRLGSLDQRAQQGVCDCEAASWGKCGEVTTGRVGNSARPASRRARSFPSSSSWTPHRPATGYISGLIRPVSLSKSSGRSASGNTSAHAGMVVPDRIAGIEVLVNVSFDILVRLMLKRGAGQDGRRVSAASRIGRGWRASTKMCVVGNGSRPDRGSSAHPEESRRGRRRVRESVRRGQEDRRIMSEATEFTIGSKVSCSDGDCGELRRVVVDPLARALTHLVVEAQHRQGIGTNRLGGLVSHRHPPAVHHL